MWGGVICYKRIFFIVSLIDKLRAKDSFTLKDLAVRRIAIR